MKTAKVVLSAALVATTLLAGCQTPNVSTNTSFVKEQAVVQDVNKINTENTDISEHEIAEINKLMQSSDLSDNSFSIASLERGKDIDTELLLYNPKASKRAKFWGLKTADKLLNAGSSPTKRWILTRKLGGLFPSEAFKTQVLFWVERADMLRIKEVTLDDSFLLVMSGITSVPHLARFNNPIDQAALKVQLSLLAFQYGKPIPSFDEIKAWTTEATTLAPVLY